MSNAAQPSYRRETLICGADMLKALGHSGFDRFLLELDLPDETIGKGSGLMARVTSLAQFAIKNPAQLSPERRTIAYEIVRRATQLWHENVNTNFSSGEREKFAAAMEREGQSALLQPDFQTHPPAWATATATVPVSRIEAEEIAFGPTMWLPDTPPRLTSQKVFVVHGHDQAALQSVARFLERLGLQAIILSEQPDQGRTIIEKFEDCAAEVGFAVVLLTGDDTGGVATGSQPARRARQNVVFELGYFAGKLGRGRVCLLRKAELEIPSDLYGVIYTEMDVSEGWKAKLARELKAAKLEFDANRVWE